jgi:hypothetical protein
VAALLIILLVTVGLAVRARAYARRWNPAEVETSQGTGARETGALDTFARTFALVLIALMGLLALGMMYGNVLGSANASR